MLFPPLVLSSPPKPKSFNVGARNVPSSLSNFSMAIRNPSNATALIVAAVATALASSAPSNASGNNSANTIQIIHPALKPTPNGIKLVKVSTNKNDGTAVTVCGSELNTDQNKHCTGFTPLLANTVDTAKPSGMLCTPMANVTKHPCAHP